MSSNIDTVVSISDKIFIMILEAINKGSLKINPSTNKKYTESEILYELSPMIVDFEDDFYIYYNILERSLKKVLNLYIQYQQNRNDEILEIIFYNIIQGGSVVQEIEQYLELLFDNIRDFVNISNKQNPFTLKNLFRYNDLREYTKVMCLDRLRYWRNYFAHYTDSKLNASFKKYKNKNKIKEKLYLPPNFKNFIKDCLRSLIQRLNRYTYPDFPYSDPNYVLSHHGRINI